MKIILIAYVALCILGAAVLVFAINCDCIEVDEEYRPKKKLMKGSGKNKLFNINFTYCNGLKCAIREKCKRFVDGCKAKRHLDDDERSKLSWMDECEGERDGYIKSE